jgi:spore germination cell wall hydrolase CwlJ-like protein
MLISNKIFAIIFTPIFVFLSIMPLQLSAGAEFTEEEINVMQAQYVHELLVKKENAKQIECLAKAMYFEASGESYDGRLAVGQVVMNRLKHYRYPKSICGVVYQTTKNNDKETVYQFSWSGNPPKITNHYIWNQCIELAQKALTNNVLHDKLAKLNALYFHEIHVSPDWKYQRIMQIGNHIFYR